MPKIDKALRRDRKRHRNRYGMAVVGDSTRRVMRALRDRVEWDATMDGTAPGSAGEPAPKRRTD